MEYTIHESTEHVESNNNQTDLMETNTQTESKENDAFMFTFTQHDLNNTLKSTTLTREEKIQWISQITGLAYKLVTKNKLERLQYWQRPHGIYDIEIWEQDFGIQSIPRLQALYTHLCT
jgi:hypothetical protein